MRRQSDRPGGRTHERNRRQCATRHRHHGRHLRSLAGTKAPASSRPLRPSPARQNAALVEKAFAAAQRRNIRPASRRAWRPPSTPGAVRAWKRAASPPASRRPVRFGLSAASGHEKERAGSRRVPISGARPPAQPAVESIRA
jgi:hypothetical protein